MITLTIILVLIYIMSFFKAYRVDFNFNKLSSFWEAWFCYGTLLTIMSFAFLILVCLP